MRLLDFIYPSRCELCEQDLTGNHTLCLSCTALIKRTQSPYCQYCGKNFEGLVADLPRCPECQDLHFAFHFAFSYGAYTREARTLIAHYKYLRRIHLTHSLGKLLTQAFKDEPRLTAQNDWLVIPVPLHRRRQQWRWFNQSSEIGKAFARENSLDFGEVLTRTKHTQRQALLSKKQRLQNLKGAFKMKQKHLRAQSTMNRSIILIDDVYTTGATVHECAKVLKDSGEAEKVVVLTLLRG